MRNNFSWGWAAAIGSLSVGITVCTKKYMEFFRLEEYFIPVAILLIIAAVVSIFFNEKHIKIKVADEKGEEKTIRISYTKF